MTSQHLASQPSLDCPQMTQIDADGTPAACLSAGTADLIALPVGAPLDVFPVALEA